MCLLYVYTMRINSGTARYCADSFYELKLNTKKKKKKTSTKYSKKEQRKQTFGVLLLFSFRFFPFIAHIECTKLRVFFVLIRWRFRTCIFNSIFKIDNKHKSTELADIKKIKHIFIINTKKPIYTANYYERHQFRSKTH